MIDVASSVVHEVLGRRIQDVDQPIVDYIVNVLADEDFDWGEDGDGVFNALGELLVAAECVSDFDECRLACTKLSDRFGRHRLVKEKPAVRSLSTPFRMDDGMEEEAPKKKPELMDGPVMSERDRAKIERKKRKDDRQREDLDAVEALIQGLVLFQGGILMVSHDEHLISGSVDELWVVSEGRATPFHGNFNDYKKLLQS